MEQLNRWPRIKVSAASSTKHVVKAAKNQSAEILRGAPQPCGRGGWNGAFPVRRGRPPDALGQMGQERHNGHPNSENLDKGEGRREDIGNRWGNTGGRGTLQGDRGERLRPYRSQRSSGSYKYVNFANVSFSFYFFVVKFFLNIYTMTILLSFLLFVCSIQFYYLVEGKKKKNKEKILSNM